jgi:hypothetical protein
MSDDTLTGRTTRAVTFVDKAQAIRLGHVVSGVRRPAGTLVYVEAHRTGSGTFRIRIPGTLLEQEVSLGAVEPE